MSLSATLIDSPIPRVPPVTIATRAMCLSSSPGAGLSLRQPACKFTAGKPVQHRDAFAGIVKAIEQREALSAGMFETLATADAELFERLQTVGREARCRDGNP